MSTYDPETGFLIEHGYDETVRPAPFEQDPDEEEIVITPLDEPSMEDYPCIIDGPMPSHTIPIQPEEWAGEGLA